MKNLAKRIGMKQILGIYENCLIGYVPGFSGISICTENRGVAASGFLTYVGAKNYINILKNKK